jgi:hypothetical protein
MLSSKDIVVEQRIERLNIEGHQAYADTTAKVSRIDIVVIVLIDVVVVSAAHRVVGQAVAPGAVPAAVIAAARTSRTIAAAAHPGAAVDVATCSTAAHTSAAVTPVAAGRRSTAAVHPA